MRSIKKDIEFKRILSRGRKIFGSLGIIYREPANELCLGIITSKKLGSAVIRNRIRRRIREAVKVINNATPIPARLVLIPKKETINMKFNDIKAKISDLLEKI